MNPKNRRLRRSVAAAGISLLGIGMVASHLILGASAPVQAAEGNAHLLVLNVGVDNSRSALLRGTSDSLVSVDLSNGFCVEGPFPVGLFRTPYLLRNGTPVKVTIFSSPNCSGHSPKELNGTVPFQDGKFEYLLG